MEVIDYPHDAFITRPITWDVEEMRVCRNLIFQCYRPLYAIESQAHFHQVFIHAVRAHHQAYTTAQVLHRDINMNNIMWYKCGEEAVGVLCDLDTAGDDSISAHAESRYRTGTAGAPDPYMAVDLLVMDPPPPHKYRHDLESFFYLYVCAAATFDPDREQKIRVIAQWNRSSSEAIGLLKRQFLGSSAEYKNMLRHAPAQFQPAVQGVLRELWFLFFEVEDLAYQISTTAIRSEHAGESPEVTQRKLADIENQRDELASYAKFMEILKVPSHEL